MKCACGKEAVLSRPYDGSSFCRPCLSKAVEKKFNRTVRRYDMLRPGDKIALAFSGSPGSLAALVLMDKITRPRRDVSLGAIIIDEGIRGRRDITGLRAVCEKLGIESHTFSFKKEFGKTLEQAVQEKKAEPCVLCSIAKRYMMNRHARELGYTRICTGHTLDEETETILLNYFRGDLERAARTDYVVDSSAKKKGGTAFIPRIKPLRQVPLKEATLFLQNRGLEARTEACPFNAGLRPEAGSLLKEMEKRHPGIRFSFLETFEKILPAIRAKGSGRPIRKCSRCGEPTPEKVCKACELWRD